MTTTRAGNRSDDGRNMGLDRGGFTLFELVIGIALFVTLSAVVIPAVVTQVKKGEVSALVNELDGYVSGIGSFYVDVARYPSEVNQLVFDPDGATSTEDGGGTADVDDLGFWQDNSGSKKSFPNGRIKRWDGPYLEVGYVPASGGISTNLGGSVVRNFVLVCTGGKRWLALAVTDISLTDARSISTYAEADNALGPVFYSTDGDTYASTGSPSDGDETDAGLVRWYDSLAGGTTSDGIGDLLYLVVAVGAPGCSP